MLTYLSKSVLLCFVQTIFYSSFLKAVWFITTSFNTVYSVACCFAVCKVRVTGMRNKNDTLFRANVTIFFTDHNSVCWQYMSSGLQFFQNVYNLRQNANSCQSKMFSLIRNISSIVTFPEKVTKRDW